jgi:hypothetical protein
MAYDYEIACWLRSFKMQKRNVKKLQHFNAKQVSLNSNLLSFPVLMIDLFLLTSKSSMNITYL